MAFAGHITQLGLSVAPVPFLRGPVSREQFLERKDACTKQQLAALLASEKYRRFERRHYRLPAPSRFSEVVLLVLATAVFLLLVMGSWTQHSVSREVRGTCIAASPGELKDSASFQGIARIIKSDALLCSPRNHCRV